MSKVADEESNSLQQPFIGSGTLNPAVWRVTWTIAIDAAMFGIGVALAMLGPTLEALGHQLEMSVAVLGSVFSFRAGGYLLGATVCGPVLDRARNPALVFLAPLTLAAIGAAVLPAVKSYILACLLFSFQGISMGILDTGGNVLILALWRDSSWVNGHMHAMHFFFGVGAAAAPAIVAAALEHGYKTILSWCVTGAAFSPCCLGLLFLAITPQPNTKSDASAVGRGLSSTVLISGAFLFVYLGLEAAYGGYLTLFAERGMAVSHVHAAHLTSLYWGMLTAGRLVAALVTPYVNHTMYLLAHLVMAAAAMGALTFASTGTSTSWLGVSVSTGFYGFALAPLFPGAMLLAEETLGRAMSGTEASVIVALAALGEMSCPTLVGLAVSYNAKSFGWVFFGMCLLASTIFACILMSGVSKLHKNDRDGGP